MHIMYTVTYPLKSAKEVVKAFMVAMKNPLPDYITRSHVYNLYGGKGIKAYTIYEIERGHEDEGLMEIAKRMTAYIDIEEFEISTEVLATIDIFFARRVGCEPGKASPGV